MYIPVSGRNELSLKPLLTFLARYATHTKYIDVLLPVVNTVLDLYQSVIGQSTEIDELLKALQQKVKRELDLQKELHSLLGIFDMLFTANSNASTEKQSVKLINELQPSEGSVLPPSSSMLE